MKESVLLVQPSESNRSLEASPLAEQYEIISLNSTDEALKVCKQSSEKVASIVLGSKIKDPIQTSQRLYALDKSLSVLILTERENVEAIRKSINFTPFIGNLTVCLADSSPANLFPEVRKLADRTIKHRQSKKLASEISQQLVSLDSHREKASSRSKEYIERLFDAAPIGIITVTGEGLILALNEASSQMFEIDENEFVGAKIQDIFPGLLLISDRKEEISRQTKNGPLHLEMTITNVEGKDQSSGYLLLFVNITDRKENERALEAAVKIRDEFLSIASHELKTPITSLQLQIQIAKRTLDHKDAASHLPRLKSSTDMALKQVERLSRLVEDLLDVSTMESGKTPFIFEEMDLSEVLKNSVERLIHQADLVNCQLEVEAPDHLPLIGDPFRLDQVITNLLINAFKYARGKPVKVTLNEENDKVHMQVKDHGIGIEEEKIPLIFNRFERAISHNNISGLGLGLYICKNIVQAHRGSISVESKLNIGSTFTVTLPKNPNEVK